VGCYREVLGVERKGPVEEGLRVRTMRLVGEMIVGV